jgi:hypothetical protein
VPTTNKTAHSHVYARQTAKTKIVQAKLEGMEEQAHKLELRMIMAAVIAAGVVRIDSARHWFATRVSPMAGYPMGVAKLSVSIADAICEHLDLDFPQPPSPEIARTGESGEMYQQRTPPAEPEPADPSGGRV